MTITDAHARSIRVKRPYYGDPARMRLADAKVIVYDPVADEYTVRFADTMNLLGHLLPQDDHKIEGFSDWEPS